MQSGRNKVNLWLLDWDTAAHKWENPLMGWTSRWVNPKGYIIVKRCFDTLLLYSPIHFLHIYSADTNQALTMKFDSLDDAIHFAEKQGYPYWVDQPKDAKPVSKNYAENYKVGRRTLTMRYLFY